MFHSGSQQTIVVVDLVKNLELELHDHPSPYPLGCVNKEVDIKVTK